MQQAIDSWNFRKKVPLPNGMPGNTKLVKVTLVKRQEHRKGRPKIHCFGVQDETLLPESHSLEIPYKLHKSGGNLYPLMIQPGLS